MSSLQRQLFLLAIAVLVTACGSTASPSPPGSTSASQPAIGSPGTLPEATPTIAAGGSLVPSSAPVPVPSASGKASPTPAPVAWSKPIVVPGMEGCREPVAAIDDRGGHHLAATCFVGEASEIRYSTSPDGRTWSTTAFHPPTDLLDQDPELAVDGDTLYLAFTRDAPTDGDCGPPGVDLGVLYRTRTLGSGEWSDTIPLGSKGDGLLSFRVRGGVLHATVTSVDRQQTWYERRSGAKLDRVRIEDAQGSVALRVGDDGKPRIAYEGANGIGFGTISDGKAVGSTIPGSQHGFGPILVLGPGNDAFVAWNNYGSSGFGCDVETGADTGSYFATNAGGTWSTVRFTKTVGARALTLDPATGDALALVTGEGGHDPSSGDVGLTLYRITAGGNRTR